MLFNELNIIEQIQKALSEAGYKNATPIQEQSIPAILGGKDLLGCAQTGTGKTAAFAIPILQNVIKNKKSGKRKIKALIVAPTRELAIQIEENFIMYSKYINIKNTVIFGGVPQNPQTRVLNAGVDILVATPGRLLDLIGQGYIELANVEHFVLDEADRMFDMGMIDDVKKIVAKLPDNCQKLLFSATMPQNVIKFVYKLLKNPVKVQIAPVSSTIDTITQEVYFVDKRDKKSLLIQLLKDEKIKSLLVFSRTKHGANHIVNDLERVKIQADAIHGNKSQNARQRALSNFKNGKIRVLVATDIAARGIDVEDLTHVINYDLPDVPETYVHRIGRTGRAGHKGVAITFCENEEKYELKRIEKVIGKTINVVDDVKISKVFLPKASFNDRNLKSDKNISGLKSKQGTSHRTRKSFSSNKKRNYA